MKMLKTMYAVLGGMLIACAAGAFRPPSVPLVTVDPFFSVWSPADKLADAPTEHWSGAKQPMNAVLRVDGKAHRLLGTEPADVPALPQTGTAPLKPKLPGRNALAAEVRQTQERAHPFRIATFNIRCPVDKTPHSWEERAPKCRALVQKHGFDLMGLQEATWQQIQDLLRMENWAFVGAGRDDGMREGEYSCIFYRTDRFEVLKSGTFWLSETPDVPGSKSWNTAYPRVCTWADMKDKVSGKSFVVFNTHLDHRSAEARVQGMRLILARMAQIAQGRPVFLTGDMNAYPGTRPADAATAMADFKNNGPKDPQVAGPYSVAAANLRDSFDISQTPHTGPIKTFSGFKYVEHPQGQPIDYIFVSAGIDVLTHATLNDSENGLYPSDHFPVMAEVVVE